MDQSPKHFVASPRSWWFAALLGALTFLIFSPALRFDFLNYDDNIYVTKNPVVRQGLTWSGVKWAFVGEHASNWHPITWLSHMLDCSLFGMNPAGHHATSIIIHCFSTSILFLLFLKFGISFWRAAVGAAIFGWHPLRVESVIWIAERKDVLSVFFALLSIWFYVDFARARDERRASRTRYCLLSLICFALSLASKPTMVTLPVVLLLLDYWPLRRLSLQHIGAHSLKNVGGFVAEKTPFWCLSLFMAVLAVWTQAKGGAVVSIKEASLMFRLENSVVSVLRYIGKILWPSPLALPYPVPTSIAVSNALICGIIIALVTCAVWHYRERLPSLVTGWGWFVVTLLPVIGLVQVGDASLADRFTYVPMIGLLLALQGLPTLKFSSLLPKVVFVVLLTACVVVTEHHLPVWQNNFTLFSHSAAVTKDNYIAHNNVARMLIDAGKTNEGLLEFRESIRIKPNGYQLHNNYGKALAGLGRTADAAAEFEQAITLNSNYALAYANLGAVLTTIGKQHEAEAALERAVKLDPIDPEAHINFANLLFRERRTADALREYESAIANDPTNSLPHLWMARLLIADQPNRSIDHLRTAIELQPEWPVPYADLAWLLSTYPDERIRNGSEAVRLSEQACALTKFQDLKCLASLDVAYAEAGRFEDAITVALRAQQLAQTLGKASLASSIQQRIDLYRSGKPFHKAL